MEPLEEVVCELEDEFSGPVIDALSLRRAEVLLLQLTVDMLGPVHIWAQSVPMTSPVRSLHLCCFAPILELCSVLFLVHSCARSASMFSLRLCAQSSTLSSVRFLIYHACM